MSLLRSYQSVCILSLICLFTPVAGAADISTLQTALSLVREDMEKAKNEHDAKVKAVAEQQRVVAERKKTVGRRKQPIGQDAKGGLNRRGENTLTPRRNTKKPKPTLMRHGGKNNCSSRLLIDSS